MNFFKKLNEKRKERNLEIEEKNKELLRKREERFKEETLKRKEREKEIENKKKEQADNWEDFLLSRYREHRFVLYEEWNNSYTVDQYGNEDSNFFDQEELYSLNLYEIDQDIRGFNSGYNYFFKSVIMRDISPSDFMTGWNSYLRIYNPKDDEGDDACWQMIVTQLLIKVLQETIPEVSAKEEERINAGFSEDMSGEDYEVYCGNILEIAGWVVEQTSKTNDQGVDLIAAIDDLKVCIQCKRYTNPVGNKAVQEIIAGQQFYGGTHAVVVSNAGFTKSAQTLASKTGVILISDEELENLEDYVY